MIDQDQQPRESPGGPAFSGPAVFGVLLVAAGVALLFDRLGALPASWRLTVWPILLMGYGVARLAQPQPLGREGLFFVIAGAWWYAGMAGWLSFARSWPILIVAAGASLVFEAVTSSRSMWSNGAVVLRQRRRAAVGWIVPVIIVGAVLSSNIDRNAFTLGEARVGEFRTVAVLGKRTSRVPATALTGGDMFVLMGENSLDLRQVTIPDGSTATLNVVTMMGKGTITVPKDWVVDMQAVPIMGNVRSLAADDFDDWTDHTTQDRINRTSDASAPRLTIRGFVMMGELSVRSNS
jgi:hypothetical protein